MRADIDDREEEACGGEASSARCADASAQEGSDGEDGSADSQALSQASEAAKVPPTPRTRTHAPTVGAYAVAAERSRPRSLPLFPLFLFRPDY